VSSAIIVIGIDCAAQAKNIGVAVGESAGDRCRVYEVFKCSQVSALIDRVASVLGRSSRALLSLDAPLGWPVALISTLRSQSRPTPRPECGPAFLSRHGPGTSGAPCIEAARRWRRSDRSRRETGAGATRGAETHRARRSRCSGSHDSRAGEAPSMCTPKPPPRHTAWPSAAKREQGRGRERFARIW
jgi:hypothetical protein